MPLYDDGNDPRAIKKIRDARVDRFISEGDLRTLEILADELQQRIPDEHEVTDPRRQRHERRIARVRARIAELRQRSNAAGRGRRAPAAHESRVDATVDQEVEA